PEAVVWSKIDSTISIKLRDTSFSEQLVYEHQLFALNSAELLDKISLSEDEFHELLSTTGRWDYHNPNMEKILTEITFRTNKKIQGFFSYISE
ncbi:hypothetical protein, partial [Pseudomonas viridiflava]|uniref:hypothetical protein n=1 Tax=Pseudomonas viridiflava TaxID=33069 RepID=UPI0019D14F47